MNSQYVYHPELKCSIKGWDYGGGLLGRGVLHMRRFHRPDMFPTIQLFRQLHGGVVQIDCYGGRSLDVSYRRLTPAYRLRTLAAFDSIDGDDLWQAVDADGFKWPPCVVDYPDRPIETDLKKLDELQVAEDKR